MLGRRSLTWVLGAALPAALLAGCSTERPSSGRADDSSASDTITDPAAPDTPGTAPGTAPAGPGEGASDLAGIAEELAGQADRDPNEAVLGGDISWPQCPRGLGIPERPTEGMPMPLDVAEYVVIGLTNGPGFTPNPCLADQLAWVGERNLLASAYAVGSYPDEATLERYRDAGPYDGSTPTGALQNTGYAQAEFNIASMQAVGFATPIVWLDIEPVPDFEWSADEDANAAVVQGLARAYTDAGYEIGVYSTPHLWTQIVGGLELGVPEWRAAGHTSREEALSRCETSWVIQGGTAVLTQWVEADRDQNVTCPGIAGDLGRWFHQY